LFGKSFRRAMQKDSYNGKTMFKARALTDMFPLSANRSMAIDGGSTGGAGGANIRYAFKGRIIGENSPHSFLPDPCDPSAAADENQTYRTIAMHTTFLSTNVIEGNPVSRGDIVLVELDKTDRVYNLEYGRFLSITSQEKPASAADTECFSLIGLLGGWEAPSGRLPGPSAAAQIIVGSGGAMAAARKCSTKGPAGGQKVTIDIPSYFRFNKSLGTALLDPLARPRFDRFLERAKNAGFKVSIGSVRRSPKHQWVLYTYKCLGGMKPAAPCYSEHQYGFAMDVTFTKQDGTKCLYANNCIPNELQPIAAAADINLTGYGSDADPVHWAAKTPADRKAYGTQLAKCKAHFYKNNTYTANAGADKAGAKNWPVDFKDNVAVIGWTGDAIITNKAATTETLPTATYDDDDMGVGKNWYWVDDAGNAVATKELASSKDLEGGKKWWFDIPNNTYKST